MLQAIVTYFNSLGIELKSQISELPCNYSDSIHFIRDRFQRHELIHYINIFSPEVDFKGYLTVQEIRDDVATGKITLIFPLTGTTFNQIREYNVLRLPHFKNKNGQPSHKIKDGSDWTVGDWLTTICGEAGEACGEWKKYLRGEVDYNTFVDGCMKELADIVHYCDLTAFQLRRNLGEAVRLKYNEISDRIGVEFQIPRT